MKRLVVQNEMNLLLKISSLQIYNKNCLRLLFDGVFARNIKRYQQRVKQARLLSLSLDWVII